MTDILAEELAAIRRIRNERLKELMRDLEEGRLRASPEQTSNATGADDLHLRSRL